MNKEKLYGIYPGSLNVNIINKLNGMTEEETFKLIYYIEDEIFWSQHEDRNHTIDLEELKEKYYALDYVIYSTNRFGINFNTPSVNRLETTQEYLNWYKKWSAYLFKIRTKKKIK